MLVVATTPGGTVALNSVKVSKINIITQGNSLWTPEDATHIMPKGGMKVNAEWLDLDTITDNNYTDIDAGKVDKLIITGDGTKFLGDDGTYQTIDTSDKQDTLISGTNIKTINSNSILGSGDLAVSGVPTGGTTGQLLSKNSDTNFDVEWSDPSTATPKSGTGTITTTGWVANTGDYAYKLDLAISGIEDSDVIMVAVNSDNMDTATAAQLCPTIDSYDGGITFYAKTVPADTIGFSYFSVVTTSQNGGDFTKGISFYVDGELNADTGLYTVHSPIAMTVKEVLVSVDTAPTGASLIVDLNKNGTTLYTTQANRPTITAGNTTATVSLPDVLSVAKGDKISLDIDQVGSTISGSNLALTLICEV